MFKPVADKEWVMKKLESFVQSTMKIDDFTVKWLTFTKRMDVKDWHGAQIFERNEYKALHYRGAVQDWAAID